MKHLYLLLAPLASAAVDNAATSPSRSSQLCCIARPLFPPTDSSVVTQLKNPTCAIPYDYLVGWRHRGSPEQHTVSCLLTPTTNEELKALQALVNSGTPLYFDTIWTGRRRSHLIDSIPQTWAPSPLNDRTEIEIREIEYSRINQLKQAGELGKYLCKHMLSPPLVHPFENERANTMYKIYQLFMHYYRFPEPDNSYSRTNLPAAIHFTSSGSMKPGPVISQQEQQTRSAARAQQRAERRARQVYKMVYPNGSPIPHYFKCTPPSFEEL